MPAQRIDYPKYEYISEPYQSRYGDTVAAMLGRQGQQRAALELQRGQASADLWRGIGQSVGGAVAGYQEQKARDVELARRAAIDKQTADANAIQLSNAKIQNTELQRGVNERDFTRQAMSMALKRDPEKGIATYDRDTLSQAFGSSPFADKLPEVFKGLDEADAASQKVAAGKREALAGLAYGVKQAGDSPDAFQWGMHYAIENGLATEKELAPYMQAAESNPASIAEITQSLAASHPKFAELLQPEVGELSEGGVTYDKKTGKIIAQAPPKRDVNPTEAALAAQAAAGDQNAVEALRLLRAQHPPRPAGGGRGTAPADAATAIADAIISGDQPPTMQGLYGNTAAVRAALAKKGFDLSTAQQDWTAINRYMSTLNGVQQVRLKQATEFVRETVPLVRELSTNLTKAVPRGQFPVLNAAALKAAHEGVLGEKAQAAATQLQSQIADLQSELAVMYRGGNSPTDEALKKASEMLRGDWSATQLEAALALVERNSVIRLNSIRNVGVGTIGDRQNQYAPAPGGEQVAPPPPGTVPPPPGARVEPPAAPAGVQVRTPDGKVFTFTTQAAANAFKREAKIP